jgi:hypothetical protein
VHYSVDQFRNFTKSISIDRPFFSPFARWAAGVNLMQLRKDSIFAIDSILQRYKFNAQDYWAGYAVQIFKGNTEYYRTTNFISAVRFSRRRYLEKPNEMYDTLHKFSNEDFYLASIGISARRYVLDKYIFNFGLTEDVPIGKVYNLTAGYQEKNNIGRFYLGARVSLGYYYPWGYLTSDFEYGTFFHGSHAEQGILTAGVNYFTGLLEIGKWKLRQFVKAQINIGINRLPSDSITLNDGYGIDGFNSPTLAGPSRLLLRLQTQTYAPWNLIGFRFGPYLVFSLGMVGDETRGFKNSTMYSQIGLGVLIKNDYLIFGTFEFSIAFYPLIPGRGSDIFKFNAFTTKDFGLRDFEIGKPAIITYQ